MSEPATEYTSGEVEDRARLNLGKNLLKALIEEIRLLERPWQATSEQQQQEVIDRLAKAVNFKVREAIGLLVTENFPAVPGRVEQVVFKDGVKATIKIDRGYPAVHDLADREGNTVLMVITDPSHFLDSMDEVEADEDQGSLGLDDQSGGEPRIRTDRIVPNFKQKPEGAAKTARGLPEGGSDDQSYDRGADDAHREKHNGEG